MDRNIDIDGLMKDMRKLKKRLKDVEGKVDNLNLQPDDADDATADKAPPTPPKPTGRDSVKDKMPSIKGGLPNVPAPRSRNRGAADDKKR